MVFNLQNGKILRTKDVVFNVHVFPLKGQLDLSRHSTRTDTTLSGPASRDSTSSESGSSDSDTSDVSTSSTEASSSNNPSESEDSDSGIQVEARKASPPNASTIRQHKTWQDHRPSTKSGVSERQIRADKRARQPQSNVTYSLSLVCGAEPAAYEEAITCEDAPHWIDAINSERQSLLKHDVFEIIDRQPWMKIISGKWVFKIKYDSNHKIDKFKARWVMKGYLQKLGVDYNETFAQVVKSKSIRLVIAMAAETGGDLYQYDVATAFPHAKLEEDVYCYPPQGMDLPQGKIMKLNKALYGLKQSSKCWGDLVIEVLEGLNFKRLPSDLCIYRLVDGPNWIILVVYVGDFYSLGNSQNLRLRILQQINERIRAP